MSRVDAGLPVIGHGPDHAKTEVAARWLRRLRALELGALVDVLLDDGRVVRSSLRVPVPSDHDGPRCLCWVVGIRGSYAAGRVRPAGGWRRQLARVDA